MNCSTAQVERMKPRVSEYDSHNRLKQLLRVTHCLGMFASYTDVCGVR
jgi:hypothetical protein